MNVNYEVKAYELFQCLIHGWTWKGTPVCLTGCKEFTIAGTPENADLGIAQRMPKKLLSSLSFIGTSLPKVRARTVHATIHGKP